MDGAHEVLKRDARGGSLFLSERGWRSRVSQDSYQGSAPTQ